MSTYYLLADHSIGPYVFVAGSTQATADIPGGLLPVGWIPSNAADAQDAGALAAFYANGPCSPPPFRAQFSTQPVNPPKTFWQKVPVPNNPSVMGFKLTGLGASLPMVFRQNGVGGNGR